MTAASFLASLCTLSFNAAAPRNADGSKPMSSQEQNDGGTVLQGVLGIGCNNKPVAAAAVRVVRSPGVLTSTADLTAETKCSWLAPASSAISMQ